MADIVFNLRERALIRRQSVDRRSVKEGLPDRLADQLEEAADKIEALRMQLTWASIALCLFVVSALGVVFFS